jgi:hypothetical protein
MFELTKMVEHALDVDEDWQPPPRFAFTIDDEYELIDFTNPLSRLRNHVRELWDALPPIARVMYYSGAVSDGLLYSLVALMELQKLPNCSEASLYSVHALAEMLVRRSNAIAPLEDDPVPPAAKEELERKLRHFSFDTAPTAE